MRIVVDFRIRKDFSPFMAAFFEQLWMAVAIYQPASQYLLLGNEDIPPGELPANMSVKKCKRKTIAWLEQRRLVNILNEYHAAKFIVLQEGGLSVFSAAKHFFVKSDILNRQSAIAFGGSYQTNTPSPTNDNERMKIVEPVVEAILEPLSWAAAESIKTQYSGGRDFFLFTGDIDEKHQLIELLKAFSIFKKWQQSNMQLIIAGYAVDWTSWFEDKLITYKYKHDVVLLKNLSFTEIAKLTAVSYAVLYPGTSKVLPLALLFAMQSGTAFIATDNEMNRQYTDAALWVDENNTEQGFGNAMITLYKDENQKQILIQKIKQEAKHFSRQRMLKKIWEGIKQK